MKKAIFGMFREYKESKDSLKREAQEKVIAFLKQHYNLAVGYDLLGLANYDITRISFQDSNFSAMLTNVPPSMIPYDPKLNETEKFQLAYEKTLGILKSMKTKISPPGKTIPCIAYTSVKPEFKDLFLNNGIDAIILKSSVDNWENEAREIKDTLDKLIK